MTPKNVRILQEPDFVAISRYDYSLKKLLERYPDESPDKVIALALMLEEEQVEIEYQLVVAKMRALMGVTV